MRVLLTRPQAQTEELGAVLKRQGIEWLGEPLLRIVPVSWSPDVLAGRQALMLTSANAAREFLRIHGVRRDMPIYAVGPDTAAPLLAEGFSNVQAADGTAVSLIGYVRRHAAPHAGPLLYLSGLNITLDLAASLAPAGLAADHVVVYRAFAAERLSMKVRRELSQERVNAAVFLSARTAAIFCSLVIASGIVSACACMTAVAISAKVAEALRPAGFGQVVVSKTPSIDGIVDAVLHVAAGMPKVRREG